MVVENIYVCVCVVCARGSLHGSQVVQELKLLKTLARYFVFLCDLIVTSLRKTRQSWIEHAVGNYRLVDCHSLCLLMKIGDYEEANCLSSVQRSGLAHLDIKFLFYSFLLHTHTPYLRFFASSSLFVSDISSIAPSGRFVNACK